MKELLIPAIALIICFESVYCQENELTGGELIIYNYSSDNIKVKVFPIGCVFNGHREYRLDCLNPHPQGLYSHIVGGEKSNMLNPSNFILNHDRDPQTATTEKAIGYGKYRVEFYRLVSGNYVYVDYCDVDYGDWDYPYSGGGNLTNDIDFLYFSANNIKYWGDNSLPADRYVKIWDQRVRCSTCVKTQNKGNFASTNANNGVWLHWPLNATKGYGGVEHLNPGRLYLNLTVSSGMTANLLAIKTMSVESGAVLTLLSGSVFHLQQSSQLIIRRGGGLCNYGRIEGPGIVFYEGKSRYSGCNPSSPFFTGGVKVILEDSAVVELADSSLLTLDNSSQLIMKPHSEFRLGTNAKIILKNGSRIVCDSAKFAPLISGGIWDGIYLNGISQDTIKYCTIENAVNGINIINKSSWTPTQRWICLFIKAEFMLK